MVGVHVVLGRSMFSGQARLDALGIEWKGATEKTELVTLLELCLGCTSRRMPSLHIAIFWHRVKRGGSKNFHFSQKVHGTSLILRAFGKVAATLRGCATF